MIDRRIIVYNAFLKQHFKWRHGGINLEYLKFRIELRHLGSILEAAVVYDIGPDI